MTPDEQAVLAVHQGWLEANKTGDVPWLRENLAPDYYMINLNGSLYDGLDHICRLWEFYRDHFEGWGTVPGDPIDCESIDPKVRVNGDAAWVMYRLRFVGNAELFGGHFDMNARGTDVMERRDGRWLIVHGHYSVGDPGGPEGGF